MRYLHKVVLFVQLFWVCTFLGQTQKTTLPVEDYALWGKLTNLNLSADGMYVGYQLIYEPVTDTLFVRNMKGELALSVAKGYSGSFLGDGQYGCFGIDNTYTIYDLRDGTKSLYKSINYIKFMEKRRIVLMMSRPNNEVSDLQFIAHDNTVLFNLKDVTVFKVSPDERFIIYCQQIGKDYYWNYLEIDQYALGSKVLSKSSLPFLNPVWDSSSLGFMYLEQNVASSMPTIHFVNIDNQKHQKINLAEVSNLNSFIFKGTDASRVWLSISTNRILFTLLPQVSKDFEGSNVVEVWNTGDKELYSERQKYSPYKGAKLGYWDYNSGDVDIIGSGTDQLYAVNSSDNFAVFSDSKNYKPSSRFSLDVDYKIVDLRNGNSHILLKKQIDFSQELFFSPDGSSLIYVRDGKWFLYQFNDHSNVLLSQLSSSFFTTDDVGINMIPYGVAGWSENGKLLYMYDEYDIWKIDFEHNCLLERLTKGREEKIVYRIADLRTNDFVERTWFKSSMRIIEPTIPKMLTLSSLNDGKTGYGLLLNNKCKRLIVEERKFSQPLFNVKLEKVVFLREDFNLPPQLVLADVQKGTIRTLFESNLQHYNYAWGRSEFVNYKSKSGDELQGALFYPMNFDARKSYPMVVEVYEDLANNIHTYSYPSYYSTNGFTVSNFTGKGYFVLLPTIKYKVGNPGFSALDCVESAVKSVLKGGFVNAKKVGIIGHSFGGYESFFICSQSNLFATGVAGAGVVNLSMMYLSLGVDLGKSEFSRFEHQQLRMGTSLFTNKEGYTKNSAISYVKSFSIPFLSWAGINDKTVSPTQSMQWYMAMRRLNKSHIMLRYPRQQHALMDAVQQKDLTLKIMDWFGYYLKDSSQSEWMFAN